MGGDPTGPAARRTQFPVGVSFGAIQGPDAETQSEEDYALAVMEATYGKPATMEDYQQLLTTGKRLYGSTQTKPPPAKPQPNVPTKDKKAASPGNKTEERKVLRKWVCGQTVDGKLCGHYNFPYASWRGTKLATECTKCHKPRMEAPHAGQASAAIQGKDKQIEALQAELKDYKSREAKDQQSAPDASSSMGGAAMPGDDFNLLGQSYDAPMRMGLGATVMDADVDANAPDAANAGYVHPTDSYAAPDPTVGTPAVSRSYLRREHTARHVTSIITFTSTFYFLCATAMTRVFWAAAAAIGIAASSGSWIMQLYNRAMIEDWLSFWYNIGFDLTIVIIAIFCCSQSGVNPFGAQAYSPVRPGHTTNLMAARRHVALQHLPDINVGMTQPHVELKYDQWFVTRILMKVFVRDTEYALAQQSAADTGFAQGQMFLDSGASTTLINDSSMLQNIRPLKWPKIVMGLTGPKIIRHGADLHLNMRNTTGEVQTVVIKDVYYDSQLKYNLISVTDISKSDYASTFSKASNKVTGPLGVFELIKTCGVYALPTVADCAPADMGAAGIEMSTEELVHLRFNHCINYDKLEILSKSGARGIPSLKCRDKTCTHCMHANITRNPAAPASTGADTADMSFDLIDMSKIPTLGGHRYVSVFVGKDRFATVVTHKTKDDIPRVLDQVLTQTPASCKPKIIKCDGAAEYHSPAIHAVLNKHSVQELRTSNAYEQHQNGRAEKFVDRVGRSAASYAAAITAAARILGMCCHSGC